MSLTYGFYNSLNGDRKYNAIQMSQIFDGIINDGVFMSIGNTLMVEADSGMIVKVRSGRAWFNHTWSYNDADMLCVVEESDVILNRIDTIVLEINSAEDVRENSIKILKGEPSTEPQKVTLKHEEYINQYPLAYIRVNKNVSEITQSDITNAVGTSECPFVTGILETINIDKLVAQWSDEWTTWLSDTVDSAEKWNDDQQKLYEEWSNKRQSEFNRWFESMKEQLSEDAAGHLQMQIDALGGYVVSDTQPENIKMLWIDSGNGYILKYYNSETETWASVAAVWG